MSAVFGMHTLHTGTIDIKKKILNFMLFLLIKKLFRKRSKPHLIRTSLWDLHLRICCTIFFSFKLSCSIKQTRCVSSFPSYIILYVVVILLSIRIRYFNYFTARTQQTLRILYYPEDSKRYVTPLPPHHTFNGIKCITMLFVKIVRHVFCQHGGFLNSR